MSAKKKNKGGNAQPSPPPPPAAPAAATVGDAPAGPEAGVAWIDSADPRKRMVGKSALVVVWFYVAALMLLALDQTFHWGIFGPKIPPVP